MTIPHEAVQAAQNEFNKFGYTAANEKALIAALTAALPFLQGVKVDEKKYVDCACTKIQQDEDCIVGYPSLLCEICNGKGVVPYVKLDGPELWEIVFGIANEVAHEITDEQYTKIAEAINSLFIETAPSPRVSSNYEARICKGIPTDCCDYGVVDLSSGIEVCRVWKEDAARQIAELLNGVPSPRAQALEEAANHLDDEATISIGRSETCSDDMVDEFCDRAEYFKEAAAFVRALSSTPYVTAGLITTAQDLLSALELQLAYEAAPSGMGRPNWMELVAVRDAAIKKARAALSSQPVADGWLPQDVINLVIAGMSKEHELLQREHFAVIVTTTTRVHHEGDERSRTHPGHGYPAYTEEIKSVEYIPFATVDDVANWVKFRRASDARPYRIIKALPMRIETSITVSLTDGGSDADA